MIQILILFLSLTICFGQGNSTTTDTSSSTLSFLPSWMSPVVFYILIAVVVIVIILLIYFCCYRGRNKNVNNKKENVRASVDGKTQKGGLVEIEMDTKVERSGGDESQNPKYSPPPIHQFENKEVVKELTNQKKLIENSISKLKSPDLPSPSSLMTESQSSSRKESQDAHDLVLTLKQSSKVNKQGIKLVKNKFYVFYDGQARKKADGTNEATNGSTSIQDALIQTNQVLQDVLANPANFAQPNPEHSPPENNHFDGQDFSNDFKSVT